VFGRCAKFLAVIALVIMTGFQWTALQTFAWATMLANNLRTQSVSEAVCETFDGNHPCPICKAIAAAKKSQKKSEATLSLSRPEFLPPTQLAALTAPDRDHAASESEALPDSPFMRPLLPPPRHFVG
jgi:hypothetical protein